ncbi:MAG: LamG domain-containing protein [Nanoarchaeota archaeon]|nr:LamG domain-containing protein [Nanoarchaeota archaeon]
MHKKRIKGKAYFYTSYRDKNGKINTKYLGSDESLAKKAEAEFKGLPQNNHWKGLLIFLLIIFGVTIFTQTSFITELGLTGASTYEILAPPSINGNVGIYNSTPYFNMSIFGYGNYSDADFDDSNGTSVYNWFVNSVLNQTGTTGQLLLCHFDNNYTCEEGEIANITQYHTEFNTTEEAINITLSEENSTIVYFNIPKTAIITEAFMNVSGYLTSAYDLLQYDYISNANYFGAGGTPSASESSLAGVSEGVGIDSWFLITNMTNLSTGTYANILSFFYGNATNTPSNGNFSYNLKICPTNLVQLSEIPSNGIYTPDGNCTSDYVNIMDTINLSAAFSDSTTGGWYNFTFNDNVSIQLNPSVDYILKFEFVEGDMSTDRYWKTYRDGGNKYYVFQSISSGNVSIPGNQQLQLYSKSNYSKGVEVYISDTNIFADDDLAFNTTNVTADFTSVINTFLSGCSDAYCDVPINISSNSSARIGLEALMISYDHYDLDGNFSQGMIANYTYTTKYGSDNNIHNHNGTIDMWVKPYWAGDDNNEYTFFTDSGSIIQLNKSSANNLVFLAGSTSVTCSIPSWTLRTWHLLTATWNQGEKVYLYIDGASCNSGNAPASISALGDSIFIGSNAENTTQANATIDELRITGFPRSSGEINSYYSETRSFFQNEVFLNSTDNNLRRDDNITFELIPKDVTGATGTAGISEINISNSPPTTPVLNMPPNDTYFSLQHALEWFNSTDYDLGDTLYYLLYIGDDDFNPLTNYNDNIIESSDPTSFFVSPVDVPDGNYSWKVLSTDLTTNSSFTDSRVVSLDSTAPNLTLTSPDYKFVEVSSTTAEQEITLYFNISDLNLENCTLGLNDTDVPSINQTLTFINQTENNFTITLAFGGYNWTINCTDIANNINTTGDTAFTFVKYNNFIGKGRTTNLSALENPANVTDLVIENPEYGVVNFTGLDLDLRTAMDLDYYVSISQNQIVINSTGVPSLNTAANLTLFNLTTTDAYILKNSANCSDECTVIDSTPATYTFSITGAGTYTTAGVLIPPTTTPVGTGGVGRGDVRALTKRSSFSLSRPGQAELRQFTMQMKKGATFFEKIKIVNTGDLLLLVSLTHNMEDYLSLSQEQFRVEPGEEKTVNVKFSALDTGIQVGNIVVTAGNIQKIIPVTLEVSSERVLVDAKMEVLPEYTELKSGDSLKAQVTLFNTGKKDVPVVVTYVIKDLEGNIVLEESETFDMSDKKSFIKTFDTSKLKAGQYVTGMNVRYLDSFSTSSARFEVKGASVKKPLFEFKWYYVIIIVSLFILVTLLKISSSNMVRLLRKKKRELKRYEK